MSLVLVGSTSGSITLQEPAVAGSTVLTLPAVTGTVLTTTSPKAGNVIQVVSTIKTNLFSTSSSGYQDVTGLSAVITPTSTSSKILILASITYATNNTTYGTLCGLRVKRDSTLVGIGGDDFSSGTAPTPSPDNQSSYATVPIMFLDSPSSTSALTYQVQIAQRIGGTVTVYVNGAMSGNNTGSSTITVMEIAA
jgi:hypothetical protein